jgi:hypothetical protein
MKKGLIFFAFGLCTLMTKAGNDKNETKLADKDKQNSTFFKMSRNSNRTSIFEQLQYLIKIKGSKSNFTVVNGQYTAINSTYDDVVELLGEPNIRVKNTLIYTLNPSNGCKAIIELDAIKNVVYLGVKDCN